MVDQTIRQIDLRGHQTVRRRSRQYQQVQILLGHARRFLDSRIEPHRFLRFPDRDRPRKRLPDTAPQIFANHGIAVEHPAQLVRAGRHLARQQQGSDRFQRLRRLVLRATADQLGAMGIKPRQFPPVIEAHRPQTALFAFRQSGRIQIITRQPPYFVITSFIELTHDVEQLLGTQSVGTPKRFEPTVNLLDHLEGIAGQQRTKNPLALLGVAERMRRA